MLSIIWDVKHIDQTFLIMPAYSILMNNETRFKFCQENYTYAYFIPFKNFQFYFCLEVIEEPIEYTVLAIFPFTSVNRGRIFSHA
jgi:hypothetical protein